MACSASREENATARLPRSPRAPGFLPVRQPALTEATHCGVRPARDLVFSPLMSDRPYSHSSEPLRPSPMVPPRVLAAGGLLSYRLLRSHVSAASVVLRARAGFMRARAGFISGRHLGVRWFSATATREGYCQRKHRRGGRYLGPSKEATARGIVTGTIVSRCVDAHSCRSHRVE